MKAEMVQRFLEQVITEKEPIREIRIRIGKPVFVLDSEGEMSRFAQNVTELRAKRN